MCNVMDDLLKSIVTQQLTLVAELKATVILSLRNIMDANANFFFVEKVAATKDYEAVAKICRASYSKLNEAF